MAIEYSILIFTLLTIVSIYFGFSYFNQKMINTCLKKELKLLYRIKQFQSCITKRQSFLRRYNFQKYNLKDALIDQDIPHI
jgi:hypothetical protein